MTLPKPLPRDRTIATFASSNHFGSHQTPTQTVHHMNITSISFTDFVRKVRDILRRKALKGWRILLTVLRKLRERGIWPWRKTVKAEDVCHEMEQRLAETEQASYRGPRTRKAAPSTQSPSTGSDTKARYSSQMKDLTQDAQAFLQANYEIRYNRLEGQAEWRERSSEGTPAHPFHPVSQVVLNTLVLRLHEEGIPVWDRDVQRLLNSLVPQQYHPISAYLESLPQWDGTDRLTPLAQRVSVEELWVKVFHTWMRGMVRQWMDIAQTDQAIAGSNANQLAPILVSPEQGLHKSTFCKLLLPPELSMLYTDKFELAGRQSLEFPLCRHALINLDEFDRFSPAQMGKLKNLMQLARMNVRRPHAAHYEQMQRTASFIGTSNTTDLLTDPTGSRRFYCQEVKQPIDCQTPIDYDQVYAQLVAEIASGMDYYLGKEDEMAIQEHNRRYYRASALREAFLAVFRKVEPDHTSSQARWMTATEIYTELQSHFGSRVINGSPVQLGFQLTFLGLEKRHAEKGNVYLVDMV